MIDQIPYHRRKRVPMSIFNQDLPTQAANYEPLSPVSFLRRAAAIRPDQLAVVHGTRRYTYREFWQRSQALGAALAKRGVSKGDCVAIMAPNTPEMLEAHNGVPLIGAVLNSLNTRLDANTVRFILEHGNAKVLLADRQYALVVEEAMTLMENPIPVIDIDDPMTPDECMAACIGETVYESLLNEGQAVLNDETQATWVAEQFSQVTDEWQAISLLYTSGTTGNPKGCVYHHRGAYLNAIGNMSTMGVTHNSRYLWTLPMFHCDGWTFTWAVTAAMGTHVCLRSVDPEVIFGLIEQHDVTHMCGAPIVLNMLANAPKKVQKRAQQPIEIATGGAAPPSAVIEAMDAIGFNVTHLYGLTETYGPATVCIPQPDWPDLQLEARSARMARQGVHYLTLDGACIMNADTMEPVQRDGETLGELMIRGNTIMKGYLKNTQATDDAFAGGWFHTGDLGVQHPDGYIEIKDRSKDIIISGGENISTLEVEESLYRHPAVLEAAVVAKPNEKWGETPCAFVDVKPGKKVTAQELMDHCRKTLAGYKIPKHVEFGPLPKTSTGKIQKYLLRQLAKDG